MKRVGLLLSGCGLHDGTEVQEAVLLILALVRRGLRPVYLAPDVEQRDVVDHSTGGAVDGAPPRAVISEAARLTRGVIRPLGEVSPQELDALVIPGGAGNVKNLCLPDDRPLGGGTLRKEVRELLDGLAERGAPVAALGLGEVVLARHQDRPLGNDPAMLPPSEVVVDSKRNYLFSPGFMGTDDITQAAEGIEKLAAELARSLGIARPPEGGTT
jgi:enhancing lycopene biosynthesis protein 2